MNVERDKSSTHPESTPSEHAGKLTGKTSAERTREVQMEVASARMQGLEPIPEFFRIAARYVAGEFTLDQFSAAVQRLRPPV
jgi:hypothetical protein